MGATPMHLAAAKVVVVLMIMKCARIRCIANDVRTQNLLTIMLLPLILAVIIAIMQGHLPAVACRAKADAELVIIMIIIKIIIIVS